MKNSSKKLFCFILKNLKKASTTISSVERVNLRVYWGSRIEVNFREIFEVIFEVFLRSILEQNFRLIFKSIF